MKTEEFTLDKEEQTIDLGMSLGSSIRDSKDKSPISIFLCGNLGTGKTTLTKGILKGLGFSGLVKSPTFNLVEIYEIQDLEIYHFDLYRINSTNELDEIDIRKSLLKFDDVLFFLLKLNSTDQKNFLQINNLNRT